MENSQLPVDILHWILALLPIVVLLVLLVLLRWTAPQAGPMGMFAAAAVALFAFATPWGTVAVASAKGVWDAIFILYVVWPALVFFAVRCRRSAGNCFQSINCFDLDDCCRSSDRLGW